MKYASTALSMVPTNSLLLGFKASEGNVNESLFVADYLINNIGNFPNNL